MWLPCLWLLWGVMVVRDVLGVVGGAGRRRYREPLGPCGYLVCGYCGVLWLLKMYWGWAGQAGGGIENH